MTAKYAKQPYTIASTITLLILLLFSSASRAQVSVALTPIPKVQFLTTSGVPLAGGKLCSYNAGTSTPAATYIDSTGTTVNTNPVVLDSGGFASVWLAQQAYKLVLYDSTGTPNTCNGNQQWSVDGVNAWSILSLANTWNSLQSFTQGASAPFFQSNFSSPALSGVIRLTSTDQLCWRNNANTQDLCISKNASDVFSANATFALTFSQITMNGVTCPVTGTCIAVANQTPNGTVNNDLAKLTGAPSTAVFTATTDTGGALGVVIAGQGTTGSATIQQTGVANCNFDGATTAGDYVQISSSVAGQCHDSGAAYPGIGQVIGRVLVTTTVNPTGGSAVDLFSAEIKGGNVGATAGCTNFTPVTVTNNNAVQNLLSCTIAANTLIQGSLLSIDLTGLQSTASGDTLTINVTLGGGTACSTTQTQGVLANAPWNWLGRFAVLTTGAGGTANWSCEMFGVTGNAPVGPTGAIGTPTISVNTTVSNVLQVTAQMSVANAGNSVTEQLLKAVIF